MNDDAYKSAHAEGAPDQVPETAGSEMSADPFPNEVPETTDDTEQSGGNPASLSWRWSVVLALLCIGSIALNGIIPRAFLIFDTLGNFQWQFVYLATALAIYQIIRKRWLWALAIGTLVSLPAISLLGLYLPATQPPAGATPVRFLTLNVFDANNEYANVIQMINKVDADIVSLVEFDSNWDAALKDSMQAYPYRIGPAFGNMVFSKLPITEDFNYRHDYDPWFSPGLGARFWVDDQLVYLMVVHTSSPTTARRLVDRDVQILGMGTAMKNRSDHMHVVAAGDFNATTHCQSMDRLMKNSGLRDSRQGFGLQNSWPVWFWPLRICIDHVLVSSEVHVHDRYLGDNVGSDHLPVIIELSFGPHSRKRTQDEIGKL